MYCTTHNSHPSPGRTTMNKPESVEYPWTGPNELMYVYPAPCFTRPAEFTLTWTQSADFRKNACTHVTFSKYVPKGIYSLPSFYFFFFLLLTVHSKIFKWPQWRHTLSKASKLGIPQWSNIKELENSVPHEVKSGSSGTPITNMAKVTFFFITGSWKFYFCPAYSVAPDKTHEITRSWGRGSSWPSSSLEFPKKGTWMSQGQKAKAYMLRSIADFIIRTGTERFQGSW